LDVVAVRAHRMHRLSGDLLSIGIVLGALLTLIDRHGIDFGTATNRVFWSAAFMLAFAVVPVAAGLLARPGLALAMHTPRRQRAWAAMRIVPAAALVVLALGVISNPLRDTEAAISNRLLTEAPRGRSIAEVEAVVRRHGWPYRLDRSTGCLDQRLRSPRTVGRQHIETNLGDYLNIPVPLATNVTVLWGFDADSRLVDIWGWKTNDGP
jgi:hypothetical protein